MRRQPRIDYRPDVVVLNMHYTGLGVARALRDSGAIVWGLSFDDTFIGNSSRYCRFALYPNPAVDAAAALRFLIEFSERFERPPLLLPTRDLDLEFLLKNRAPIESRYLLPLAPTPVMTRVLDKSQVAAAAKAIGIASPSSFVVTSPETLDEAKALIRLPCIVKPAIASRWRHGPIHDIVLRRKVVVFDRWQDLEAFYERVSPFDPELLVQEYIPGDDENLLIFGSYVGLDGELVRYFTARKILQSPPHSGTGIVVQALRLPSIVEMSVSLLRELKFTGISEIEYKLDSRTGEPFLIEINPRHWDQHTLGNAAGVNLTRALYEDVRGESVPEMQQEARAISWFAEEGYLIGLQGALRGDYPLRAYLRPLLGRKAWATLSWHDPRPALRALRHVIAEYGRGLRTLVGRCLPKFRARQEPG